ncbi:MAG: hypothetical protein CMK07_16300 [Ponticaulis sp.]|nr:hypothetical protein [Ponticaulis sp.]
MIKKLTAAVALTIFLSACASNKAPIRQGSLSGSGSIAPIPDASGPRIDANVQRLYPNRKLFVCDGTRVSNKPPTDGNNEVVKYSRLIVVDGPGGNVPLVMAPANNACVTSGFGMRKLGNDPARMHNGIDIFSRPASRVFSGGSGTILEAGMNSGYGLSVLIDHGYGVYTRYAHLDYIEDDIKVGARLVYGHPIGRMGRSGQVTGIHLHYEILTGTYKAGVWGRGLKPRDPFSFPEWVDPRLAMLDQ